MNRAVYSIVLIVCLVLTSCQAPPPPANPPVPVNLITVKAQGVL